MNIYINIYKYELNYSIIHFKNYIFLLTIIRRNKLDPTFQSSESVSIS